MLKSKARYLTPVQTTPCQSYLIQVDLFQIMQPENCFTNTQSKNVYGFKSPCTVCSGIIASVTNRPSPLSCCINILLCPVFFPHSTKLQHKVITLLLLYPTQHAILLLGSNGAERLICKTLSEGLRHSHLNNPPSPSSKTHKCSGRLKHKSRTSNCSLIYFFVVMYLFYSHFRHRGIFGFMAC